MQILIILIAAVVLGDVISALGTGTYLANLFSRYHVAVLLPAILFFITSLIGFATRLQHGKCIYHDADCHSMVHRRRCESSPLYCCRLGRSFLRRSHIANIRYNLHDLRYRRL